MMKAYRLFLPLAAALGAGAMPARAADMAWQMKVQKLVAANYSYPRSAELRGEQGRAVVRITISGVGKPVSVELIQHTGSQILDREAMRIPMKVGAYPTPPGGGNTTIDVPIRWQLS